MNGVEAERLDCSLRLIATASSRVRGRSRSIHSAGNGGGRELRTAAAEGRDALANLSFREIQKFATIRISSGAIRRIPVHRKRSPFDV